MTRWIALGLLLCVSGCLNDRDGDGDAGTDTAGQDTNGIDTSGLDTNGTDANGTDTNGLDAPTDVPASTCPAITGSCPLPWVYFATRNSHDLVRVSLTPDSSNVCDRIDLSSHVQPSVEIAGVYAPSPCRLFVLQGDKVIDVDLTAGSSSVYDNFVSAGDWTTFARGPLPDSFYIGQERTNVRFVNPGDAISITSTSANGLASITTRRDGGYWMFWHTIGLRHIGVDESERAELNLAGQEGFFAADDYRIKEAQDGRVVIQQPGGPRFWIYDPELDIMEEVARPSEPASVTLPDPRTFASDNAVIRGRRGVHHDQVNGLVFVGGPSPIVPVFRSGETTRDVQLLF